MNIYGFEEGLGASYGAKKIVDNEEVYGIGFVKVDDEKSYLIQEFTTDEFTDGAPARVSYIAVHTDSIYILEAEDILSGTDFKDNNGNPAIKQLKKRDSSLGRKIITPMIDD